MAHKPTVELGNEKASKITEKSAKNPDLKPAKSNKKLKEEEKKLSKFESDKFKTFMFSGVTRTRRDATAFEPTE